LSIPHSSSCPSYLETHHIPLLGQLTNGKIGLLSKSEIRQMADVLVRRT
jgi:hypothetical protein